MDDKEPQLRPSGSLYIMDKEMWWSLIDALDSEDLDFVIHYTDDSDEVGLEFGTQAELAYFVLKYA